MTHTILVGDGTTSILILLAVMLELRASGRGDRVSAVLVGGEPPDYGAFRGGALAPNVRYHQLPTLQETFDKVNRDRDAYPWLTEEAQDAVLGLAQGMGDGLAASPGAGRAALVQRAADVWTSLRRLHDEALADGHRVEILIVTTAVGGTSRGSLCELGLIAKSACPEANGRRSIVVLPCFSESAHGHQYAVRANLALAALAIIEDGAVVKQRSFTGKNGKIETINGRLAEEFLLVVPAYQGSGQAELKALRSVAEVIGATARMVAGIGGGDLLWEALFNETLDATPWRDANIGTASEPRVRWVCAANEARIYFSEARLRLGVMGALLGA